MLRKSEQKMRFQRHRPPPFAKLSFRILWILTVAATLLNALRASFNLGYSYSAFGCYGTANLMCGMDVVNSFITAITVGLLVASAALWFRSYKALFISFVLLLCSAAMYVLWFRHTLYVLQVAEVESFSQLPAQSQYLLPLNNATWWDLAILGLILSLLIWHSGTFISFLYSKIHLRAKPSGEKSRDNEDKPIQQFGEAAWRSRAM